jgi:hypothetical protein
VKAFNEALAIRFDPFSGDDGDSKVLQDRIVTTRKEACCHQCGETIQVGQRTRSRREVFDGEFMTFKWCQVCTSLMAEDDPAEFEARDRNLRNERSRP